MKSNLIYRFAKLLMIKGKLRICIIDDEEAYFTPQMIELANSVGFNLIERFFKVDRDLMKNLIDSPRDIVILDIKGISAPTVASDGMKIGKLIYDQTRSFVVLTSAHKFHLSEHHKSYDYVIQDRVLTAIDFIEELNHITERYLQYKIKFFKKIVFRVGYQIAKKSIIPGPSI